MPLATKRTRQGAPAAPARYKNDFYGWALEQGALLRAGRLDAVDVENLAEEIEALGRNELDRLRSFYRLILLHMLKWEHQPNLRSRSWAASIAVHRIHVEQVLEDNPSLRSRRGQALAGAYRLARAEAVRETGLAAATFPEICPFTLDEVMTRSYAIE